MTGVVAVLATGGGTFSATASPSTLLGIRFGIGTTYTSTYTAAVAQGGQPPYTYTWTFVSGDTAVLPQFENAYNTRFYAYFSGAGDVSAVYKCVVEDALAATVDTNAVHISITSGA